MWDATGSINVLHRASDDTLAANGLREVALGIEYGSDRMLTLIDKRIDPGMPEQVVRCLTERGIHVKGYFSLGFPIETAEEIDQTVALVKRLWRLTDTQSGRFWASVFECRPYPGTPAWHRLMATGLYTSDQLLNYSSVDLTDAGLDEAMRRRDEFNFLINLQLSDAPVRYIRDKLVTLSRAQFDR